MKSALIAVESRIKSDPINPPRSTLPPPLNLPTRGGETIIVYLYRIGRAYGTFYKDGVKAIWFNYRASKLLKERIIREALAKDVTDGVMRKVISRSDFQLLARNSHDIGKLPFFGLLALIFGEWLVLIVPFIPNAVPGPCKIPKQVLGMRTKGEERRRISFRQGITEPSNEQLPDGVVAGSISRNDVAKAWPTLSYEFWPLTLKHLRDDQLHHLSSTLGLHSRLWDRIQLPPPSILLRRSLAKHFHYLSQDDTLLLQHSGAASRLSPDELQMACEERGLDILGKKEEVLRENLAWWLRRQDDDRGSGRALLGMLFRRLAIREWVQLNLRAN